MNLKSIEGFEGIYAVTDDGRVWSSPRVLHTVRNGKSFSIKAGGYFLKQGFHKCGYKQVTLGSKKKFPYKVHRLVAQVFIENPLNLKEVNHKNGIKTDNRIENLEWCTRSYNIHHSFLIGKQDNRGSRNPFSKLKENDISEIRSLLKENILQKEIGRRFGVSQLAISNIKMGRTWNHV